MSYKFNKKMKAKKTVGVVNSRNPVLTNQAARV